MDKGFIVEYKDGRVITEDELEWQKVPKCDIAWLKLKWYNKMWKVPGPNCFQFKRGSIPLYGAGSDVRVDYRVIGYFEGKDKILYLIDENTGQMTIKVVPVV